MGRAFFAAVIASLLYTVGFTGGAARADYIIESRSVGQNNDRYSETGEWADTTGKSTAAGVTTGIGSRYGSTYLSVAGEKHALFTPDLPMGGLYEVFATWGNNPNRQTNILHEVTHASGTIPIDVNQSATANMWLSLGQYQFNAGTGGSVDVSNLHTDVSGSMYADAMKWKYVLPLAYFSIEGELLNAEGYDQVDFHVSLSGAVGSSETLYFRTFGGGGDYGETNAAGDTFEPNTHIDSVLELFDAVGDTHGYDNDYDFLGLNSKVTWVGSDTPLNPDPLLAGDYRLNLSELNKYNAAFAVDLVGPADALWLEGASLTGTAQITSLKMGTLPGNPGTAHLNLLGHSLTVNGPLVVANTGSAEIWISSGGNLTVQGPTTINAGGSISNVNPGQVVHDWFYANDDVTIDGGTLSKAEWTSVSGFHLASGKALTAKNDGQVILAAPYELADDTTFTIQSGADFTVGGPLNIGVDGDGTLIVEGEGSTLTTNTVDSETLFWGWAGGSANVTIRDNAVADIRAQRIRFGYDDNPTSNAFVNIESGASMTVNELVLNNDWDGTTVEFTVTGRDPETGSPSTVTQNGDSQLYLLGGSHGTTTLAVEDYGQFHTGTGGVSVAPAGTIDVNTNGVFHANGNVFVGGTIDVDGASFHADSHSITIAGGVLRASSAGLVTAGSIDVDSQWGTIELDGGAVSVYDGGATGGIDVAGTLSGTGTAILNPGEKLSNSGLVSPGGAGAAGLITVLGGRYEQDGLGELVIELGGTDPADYDRLHVEWEGSEMALGGDLNMANLLGFEPGEGDTFDILDWVGGPLTSEFDSIGFAPLAMGLAWDWSQLYTTGELSVVAISLDGDYNGNYVVDAADYTVWRDNYSGPNVHGNPVADGDGDGDVDDDDYVVWKSRFGQTVGGAAGAVGLSGAANWAVPEPTSLALIGWGALGSVFMLAAARRAALPPDSRRNLP